MSVRRTRSTLSAINHTLRITSFVLTGCRRVTSGRNGHTRPSCHTTAHEEEEEECWQSSEEEEECWQSSEEEEGEVSEVADVVLQIANTVSSRGRKRKANVTITDM
eukprot:COSAG01_NODE_19805_length_988_cov_1.480315_2_plen_106_part_00